LERLPPIAPAIIFTGIVATATVASATGITVALAREVERLALGLLERLTILGDLERVLRGIIFIIYLIIKIIYFLTYLRFLE
jgi:hypothetical protein